ncbi:TonB-dependent siderophore receptor [Termitidicoccus mucosus]
MLPAKAQDTPEAGRLQPSSEEVIQLSEFQVVSSADEGYKAANAVSATRVAVAIKDIPMNLTAFTRDFIEDRHAYDLYDIIKYAPGVNQDNVSPTGWARYNMRGFTSASVQRNGFGSFRFIDVSNIERVEIIKGPSSLLYGQINPGGVINYITKRPQDEAAVGLSASVGTDNYGRVMLDATGPVPGTNGKLLYRAVGMGEEIQRFVDVASGYKTLFAPSFTWKITPGIALTVEYERFHRHDKNTPSGVVVLFANGNGTTPYPGLPEDFSFAGDGDYFDFTSDAFTADLTARLLDHFTLRAIYGWNQYDQEWRASGQGGTGLIAQDIVDYFYGAGVVSNADAMYRRNRKEIQRGSESVGQIELAGNFEVSGVRLRPLVGYKKTFYGKYHGWQWTNPTGITSPYYIRPWNMRDPSTWDRSVPFGTDVLAPTTDNTTRSDNSSFYGVLVASLFDERLQLLGGVSRYDVHNEPNYNHLADEQTSDAADRHHTVWQGGVLYKITNEFSVFASYSESFVANSTLLQVKNVPTAPAEPSIGEGWEAGVKLDLLEGRISGTLSWYYLTVSPTGVITITDGVDPDTGNTFFTDIQGGEQRSRGVEADILFTITPGLQLYTAYGYTDAVYTEHPSNPDLDGTRLVATPKHTFRAWGKYTLQNGPARGFYFGGGVNYTGNQSHQAANPVIITGGYTTIDLVAGYPLRIGGRTWRAELSVKNVTDKFYYASASSISHPRHGILTISTKF